MAPTAILLNVLRDVGKVRKVGERPHHVERLFDAQVSKRGIKQAMRRPLAMEAHRLLTNRFHLVECRVATLRSNDVTEQSAEQARIRFKRRVFIVDGGIFIVHRGIMLHRATTSACTFPNICRLEI